jgi:hypothetical protein
MSLVARLAAVIVIVVGTLGVAAGYVEYLEQEMKLEKREVDFQRAASKYRAAKATHRALAESYSALLDAIDGADPCACKVEAPL